MSDPHRPRAGEAHVDLFDRDFLQCPFPVFRSLRDDDPVHYIDSANLYLVTRYDLVEEILRNPTTYSNRTPKEEPPADSIRARIAEIQAEGWAHVPTIATEDPPAQTQFRAIVTPFFSPARMRRYEARAREVCTELSRSLTGSPADFVGTFAEPLPVRITAEVMDLDTGMLETFRGWAADASAAVGARVEDDRRLAAERGIVQMQHYFARRLEQARATPGEDYFSTLAHAQFTDPDGATRLLTDAEILSLSRQVFVGGIETTAKMLTEGMRLLAERPEAYARLRAEPRLIPRAVEEMLRLSSPAEGIFRATTCDAELGGYPIPAGSRLLIAYAAANRDPAVFTDCDDYKPDRPELRRHLAFGKGTHFCIGAPLTRIEATVALETLTSQFDTLSLVPGANDYEYEPSFILRGLTSLWVTFSNEHSSARQEEAR